MVWIRRTLFIVTGLLALQFTAGCDSPSGEACDTADDCQPGYECVSTGGLVFGDKICLIGEDLSPPSDASVADAGADVADVADPTDTSPDVADVADAGVDAEPIDATPDVADVGVDVAEDTGPAPDTSPSVEPGDYYVSPDGDDANPGTEGSPFASIAKAINAAGPGDLIYLRGGTYTLSSHFYITKSGQQGAPIRLFGYPGERPVLDFSSFIGSSAWEHAITFDGAHWWHLRNLHVTNGPQGGIFLESDASNNLFENVESSYHGREAVWSAAGFGIYGTSHQNRFVNCDAHHNANRQRTEYDDGYGFSIVSDGEGNSFYGCRAWHNSVDGFDLYWAESPVTIERSWAWKNGIDDDSGSITGTPDQPLGGGVGFKLGGDHEPAREPWTGPADHVVRFNVAWRNRLRGFDENENGGSLTVTNNTSWLHPGPGFRFDWGSASTLRNNISLEDRAAQLSAADDANNSWNNGFTATRSDFVSFDDSVATGPRQADGSLPDSDFLKLSPGSDLIDTGVDVGEPFNGSAPDLGAFESQP